MQIREDIEPLPQSQPAKRRDVPPIERLALRKLEEDKTLRLPMSVLAFWRDPEDPNLETVRVRLHIPENPDDEVTLAGPLPDPEG